MDKCSYCAKDGSSQARFDRRHPAGMCIKCASLQKSAEDYRQFCEPSLVVRTTAGGVIQGANHSGWKPAEGFPELPFNTDHYPPFWAVESGDAVVVATDAANDSATADLWYLFLSEKVWRRLDDTGRYQRCHSFSLSGDGSTLSIAEAGGIHTPEELGEVYDLRTGKQFPLLETPGW